MDKLALFGVALGLSTIFAGCGLVPPVTFTDPVGLNGAVLTAPLSASGASLRPQVAGQGIATVSAPFADVVSFPFIPSTFNVQLAISSAAISSNCAALGATTSIAVTVSDMKVTVKDTTAPTAAAAAVVRQVVSNVPTFTFNISNTGVISNLNTTLLLFAVSNVGSAINIITTAPTPNSVQVDATIATNPALSGCSISLTFGAGSGEVKL